MAQQGLFLNFAILSILFVTYVNKLTVAILALTRIVGATFTIILTFKR